MNVTLSARKASDRERASDSQEHHQLMEKEVAEPAPPKRRVVDECARQNSALWNQQWQHEWPNRMPPDHDPRASEQGERQKEDDVEIELDRTCPHTTAAIMRTFDSE